MSRDAQDRTAASVRVRFAWYDLWVGAYIDRANRVLYLCPLPTLLVEVHLGLSFRRWRRIRLWLDLRQEVEFLKAEIAELKDEMAGMIPNEMLVDDLVSAMAADTTVADLRQEVEFLKAEIAELKDEMEARAVLQRRRRRPGSVVGGRARVVQP